SGLVWNTAQADVYQPQGLAIEMFSELQDDSQINYLNASYWLQEEVEPPALAQIRDDVLNQHLRYFVDFSMIEDESQKAEAKTRFRKKLGLAFASDFLIISEHKGELLFTPLDDENDPNIRLLEAAKMTHS
ncbi:hemolysin, partial [Vibrio anguillarum]